MNIDRAFDLCQVAVARENAAQDKINAARIRYWAAGKRVAAAVERANVAQERNATAYARYSLAARKLAAKGAELAISPV